MAGARIINRQRVTLNRNPAVDPNESVQERSWREWRENFNRISADPESAGNTDLYRAIGFLDHARRHAIRVAQEQGRKVDPNVLAGYDNEQEYYLSVIKRRGRQGNPDGLDTPWAREYIRKARDWGEESALAGDDLNHAQFERDTRAHKYHWADYDDSREDAWNAFQEGFEGAHAGNPSPAGKVGLKHLALLFPGNPGYLQNESKAAFLERYRKAQKRVKKIHAEAEARRQAEANARATETNPGLWNPACYQRESESERERMGPRYWIIGQIDDIRHEDRGPFDYKQDANRQLKSLQATYPDLYLTVRKV